MKKAFPSFHEYSLPFLSDAGFLYNSFLWRAHAEGEYHNLSLSLSGGVGAAPIPHVMGGGPPYMLFDVRS
jgi:hypothetical protein